MTDDTEPYGPFAAPFVADIGSGYVFSETGLVATDNGKIVNESLFPPDRGRRFVVAKLIWQLFFESTHLTTALARKNISNLDTQSTSIEVAAPLIPRYSDNYYHWMIETVPQIRYLRAFEAETGTDVTYLVPGDAPSWLDETLELLNIPDEKVERTSNSVYRINRLVLPSFPLQTRQDYEWIVERVLENANLDRTRIDSGSNVYISRSEAIERRVVNEAEVMETLSKYGFERYHLEDLSVTENVTLFHEADIVVGAHGAGLTDLIYCTDATVIELFGSMVKDPYEQLAETVGVGYERLECQPKSTDLYVDTENLERTVQRHLNV
ncbi:DUF563 domain-containing protein [Natronorubrum sp. JWXQ-INN-674]|uniref:DUF563 domain-containing protein n=1 Tax=Natronorubrum halalkaliphilum TaxID=2691917 RepID=A0A6B0VI38_9EURY|nr:glycosyltransferase family 61 protein [Natronorubrum halalkaliphilum]MXV61220.1 DUF563 domain-containing protein [Natronorubrum halalkaliphilum]